MLQAEIFQRTLDFLAENPTKHILASSTETCIQ